MISPGRGRNLGSSGKGRKGGEGGGTKFGNVKEQRRTTLSATDGSPKSSGGPAGLILSARFRRMRGREARGRETEGLEEKDYGFLGCLEREKKKRKKVGRKGLLESVIIPGGSRGAPRPEIPHRRFFFLPCFFFFARILASFSRDPVSSPPSFVPI